MSDFITLGIMVISIFLIAISALAFSHGVSEIVKGDHEWAAFVTTGFFAILFILGAILLLSSTGEIGADSYNISEPIQKSRVVITDSNAVIIKNNGIAITTDKYKYITILKSLDSVCLNTQLHSNIYGDVFKETVSISNCK